MKKAILYKKIPGKVIKCTACSWYCRISENQTGICGVRQNIDGDLYLLVYGKVISSHIDPVEKKPLFHFLPGTDIFSIGTVGCNFACDFCQNWDISQVTREKKIRDYGLPLSPEEIIKICLDHNIPSIAFTYNEPAIFFEYAYDIMLLAKKNNIKTIYVSNGYESEEQIKMLKGNLDAINIDLKAFTEKFYQKNCHAKLDPVLKNIKRFYDIGVWTEITTLIIPGENDSDKELSQIAHFLAGIDKNIPWHISRFHPDYKMLKLGETPKKTINQAYQIGKDAGLNYVYVGNINDSDHENTLCPKCQSLLIERMNYNVTIKNFSKGQCRRCNQKIPGIWV